MKICHLYFDMYVPPSRRAGAVASAALPPGYKPKFKPQSEVYTKYTLGYQFNHPLDSTLTMFSYHPKLTRRTRLGYDPERSPEDTPLPPSPIIPPIHPFSHLISYIVVFRNAHPDWDSAGELWIHTHAEELMKDCGAGKENFERPIPLFKEIASGERLLFEGWL